MSRGCRASTVSVQDIKLWIVQEISTAKDKAARSFPWPEASATGIGSMPGTDPAQACAVVLGEVPDFPFLPELPGRGVGADMIGRAAALLVDLPVETTARGWKLATRPGRDQGRADGFLAYDLDAIQEAAEGYEGPLKVSVCGPLTLAAEIELSRSVNPALADPGALADLTASLAEGIAAHVSGVRERITGAQVVVQIDEPSLPAVLAGRVRTASGLNLVPALDEAVASAALRSVLEATTAFTVVHCCAADLPFLFLKNAGAGAVGYDLARLGRGDIDAVAEIAEAGLGLLAGAVPAAENVGSTQGAARETAEAVVTMWCRTSLDPRRFAGQVVVTPACGLAGVSPAAARAALAHCREAARIGAEMIEEGAR
jgi:methionine synthase II (cobalamin-independent)